MPRVTGSLEKAKSISTEPKRGRGQHHQVETAVDWCRFLSHDATHASGGVIIFDRQGLSFTKRSTSSLSSLDPYSDYVEIQVSLKSSSSLSFLYVHATPIRSSPTDGRTDFFSPSSRNHFILGDFNCHHTLWDSKDTSDPRGKKVFDWVISSDLLPSMNLTYPHSSIALLEVASSLRFLLLPALSPSLAQRRCFRTWVFITY